LLYDGGRGHAAAALLHVECRIGTAIRFTRRPHKEARLAQAFGDIFTDAVALLAARKQRDWSGSAVAPLAFMLVTRRSIPVHPAKRTFPESVGMSQRCHNRTHAPRGQGLPDLSNWIG
jgi:hypothetical protein